MQVKRLFRGLLLNPISDHAFGFFADGALVVDADGIIEQVGEYAELGKRYFDAEIIERPGCILMPGFIDTHVHLPQYPAVGLYGEELLAWLNKYIFPLEHSFTPEAADRLCPVFFRDLLANGTTTAAVYVSTRKDSTDVAFEWARRTGVRAIIGKVMMDQNSGALQEETGQSLKDSEELCGKWHGVDNARLMYAFTPRFAPTCSSALMEAAGALAYSAKAYVQTHLSENRTEVEWVRRLFPADNTYTEVYSKRGLLRERSIVAHAIHLNAYERAVLKESGAGIAHCPNSNLFLRSGLMPLRELMDMNLPIGLGSDVAGGPSLSLFSVMRGAVYTHNARLAWKGNGQVSPAAVLYFATLGGARALQLHNRIGSLEPGKEADLIMLDSSKLTVANEGYISEPDALLSRLVFCGNQQIVERAYVRGQLCYERQH